MSNVNDPSWWPIIALVVFFIVIFYILFRKEGYKNMKRLPGGFVVGVGAAYLMNKIEEKNNEK